MKKLLLVLTSMLSVSAQGLESTALLKPESEWPTYYGDYSGHRYSPLSRINRSNVSSMSLAWVFKTNVVAVPTFEVALDRSALTLTSVPLEANGALYFSLSDHVWALEAKTGRLIWHFYRPAPGSHVINRGVGMYKNQIYFGTSDAHVISLDARNGKKLWDVGLGDVKFGQAISVAPLIVHNSGHDHVVVGSSGEGADVMGFLVALEPETGMTQWRWDAVPKSG